MATGCNQEPTEEIDQMLDEAANGLPQLLERNWGEVLNEVMPTVRETIHEDAERRLCFEDNQDKREFLKQDLSPKDRERMDDQKADQVARFRTLDGEFTIRHSPGSHLTIEEAKRLYREDTPHCVTRNMAGVAFVNEVKYNKKGVLLGGRVERPEDRKGVNIIYRHPDALLNNRDFADVLRGEKDFDQILADKEISTRHHEIGEEVYNEHLDDTEKEWCDSLYDRAVTGGWMRRVCDHSKPSPQQYFCDAYAMFKTAPSTLKNIAPDTFQFVQNKYLSLEVKDTFASLERDEK